MCLPGEEYEIELTTNSMGQAITSIPYGTYKVTEIEAPEGYAINKEIENIEFTESGVKTFTIEDKIKPSVVVNHYLKDREGNITETKLTETEISYGETGESYSTLPKLDLEGYELEKDESGEYVIPENAVGKYGEGETIVNYYYTEKEIPLTVHYYIEGTEEKVPLMTGEVAEDVGKKGYEGESYETIALENMSEKYELIEIPDNAEGVYGKEGITVTYYYRLKTYDIRTIVVEKEETDSLGQTVKVKGGSITGEGENPYEEVEHGETSIKPITITPDEGYQIKTIMINGVSIYPDKPKTYAMSDKPTSSVGAPFAGIPETRDTTVPDQDGTLTLSQIENITEDKTVSVEFEKKIGTITVHHYIQGTTTKVPSRVEGTVIEDEIKTGYIGDIYATKEKTSEEISEEYAYVSSSGNTSGTYTEEEQVVTYYYVIREASIIIHHYIYNEEADTESNKYTKTKLAEDEIIEGQVGQDYTTSKSSEIPANYVCIDEEPENHAGKMTEETIEISYYYELTAPTLENNIEITATVGEPFVGIPTINLASPNLTGLEETNDTTVPDQDVTPILTKERGTVTYNIKYTAEVKDYIGKVKVEIVNSLPAGIDTDKSNLAEGHYDSAKHTITWVETIENIDTFANIETNTRAKARTKSVGAGLASAREGSNTPLITYASDGTCTIEITKQIEVVFEDQDVIRDLNDKVEGKTSIYYPENYLVEKRGEEQDQAEAEARVAVKQDYKVHFKVVKEWDDNNNIKEKRPESVIVEIKVMPNDKKLTKELNAENNWTYEETVLPKYNTITGEKIKYIVEEKESNPGDLEYYNLAGIQEAETIVEEITNYTYTITNEYKLMETNLNTTLAVTGTEEITRKDEEVSYTIHLTSEIKDYIGEGKVKIVDTLPYRIDQAKSNLAGGIYDNENKKITWEINIPHINTETGNNTNVGAQGTVPVGTYNSDGTYVIDITRQISVIYEDIDLEEEKMTNQVIGTVELYDAESKDEKTAETDNLINVQGKVVVKYVDIDTNEEITPVGATSSRPDTYGYEIAGKIGTEYKAEKKEIENYIYVEAINETGKIKEKEQEAIFYYESAKTKVIIKYQDEEGNNIIEEEVIDGYVGDEYKIEQKEIESYEYVETKGNVEGTMTKEEIIITYVYKKEELGKITVKYLDIDTNEEITPVGAGFASARNIRI